MNAKQTTPETINVRGIDLVEICTDDRNPGASRITEANTKALAEELKVDGLQQPIKVRPIKKKGRVKYQIVFGERRYRAAKQLGWKSIPCIVEEHSELQSLRLMNVENAQRIDLDYIAKGNAIEQLVAAGFTVTEAAKIYGVSQGEASNMRRIATIPEPIRSAVASGKFPHTFARECLGVVHAPAVLKRVLAEYLDDSESSFEPIRTRADLLHAIHWIIGEECRPAKAKSGWFSQWNGELGQQVTGPLFKIDDALRKKLAIVTVKIPPAHWSQEKQAKEVEVCTNAKLWDQLQSEAIAAKVKAKGTGKPAAKVAKSAENVADAMAKVTDAKTPAAKEKAQAELEKVRKDAAKVKAADDKRKRTEADKKLAEKAEELRLEWLRFEISEQLDEAAICQLIAFLLAAYPFKSFGDRSAFELIAEVVKNQGGRVTRPQNHWEHKGRDEWKTVTSLPAEDSFTQLHEIARAALWSDHGDSVQLIPMPVNLIEDLAKARGIDLCNGWLDAEDQPGNEERTQFAARFFNLHNNAQLDDLINEIAPDQLTGGAKSARVDALVKATGKKFPGLLKPRAGRGRPARKS